MPAVAKASTSPPERSESERRIRAHAEAGEHGQAATLAIEAYGPELLRFVAALVRDETVAADAFAQACEDIWRALPQMHWHSSFRTWAYSVARNACYRQLRAPAARRVPLSGAEEVDKLV